MRLEAKMATYLEYCEYRKELDKKTLKAYRIDLQDRKSTRLNSSHTDSSRMPSSA